MVLFPEPEFRHDVQQLITYGTPHNGILYNLNQLASICSPLSATALCSVPGFVAFLSSMDFSSESVGRCYQEALLKGPELACIAE